DKYEHPVLKVRYSGDGSGDTLTCKFYSGVNEENPYWLYPENDTGLIASQNFKKGVETTVDLSSAELSGVQKIFFKFEGTKELEVDFTVTVTSGK
nr:hypothetical protein [Lachnospiraceae bacterium]